MSKNNQTSVVWYFSPNLWNGESSLKMYWALNKLVSTGTWNLKVHLSFTSWGGKAVAFQTWSSSVTYTLTVMSRPARERHSSERWLLGSSCLDETQCMKTTWWPFGDRYVFLAAAVKRSWQDEQCGPLFELLVRGKASRLKWGPWEHMKRLLRTYWSYCKKHSDVTWFVGALW